MCAKHFAVQQKLSQYYHNINQLYFNKKNFKINPIFLNATRKKELNSIDAIYIVPLYMLFHVSLESPVKSGKLLRIILT